MCNGVSPARSPKSLRVGSDTTLEPGSRSGDYSWDSSAEYPRPAVLQLPRRPGARRVLDSPLASTGAYAVSSRRQAHPSAPEPPPSLPLQGTWRSGRARCGPAGGAPARRAAPPAASSASPELCPPNLGGASRGFRSCPEARSRSLPTPTPPHPERAGAAGRSPATVGSLQKHPSGCRHCHRSPWVRVPGSFYLWCFA